ncbi:MAG: urease accessory protein UreD [Verrucomicrobiales bacterium]|nr:urease accessory protein UreD [Verrucomicrobiales bacterium]
MKSSDAGADAGAAFLTVERVAGASAVTSARCHQPAKLLLPVPRGPSVWACTSSFGGGFVAGDRTRLEIVLAPDTRCYIGSQASSKVYRTPPDRPCSHTTRARVGRGALLVFAPDPVQPFAGASYSQDQEFELAPSASLVFLDTLHAGRSARGERWAFRCYHARNSILVDAVPVFLDALCLDPADGPLTAHHRMGRFDALASLVLVGPAVAPAAAQVLADVASRPVARRADLCVAASPLADGALVRVAGVRTQDVGDELRRLMRFLNDLLPEQPWDRKG